MRLWVLRQRLRVCLPRRRAWTWTRITTTRQWKGCLRVCTGAEQLVNSFAAFEPLVSTIREEYVGVSGGSVLPGDLRLTTCVRPDCGRSLRLASARTAGVSRTRGSSGDCPKSSMARRRSFFGSTTIGLLASPHSVAGQFARLIGLTTFRDIGSGCELVALRLRPWQLQGSGGGLVALRLRPWQL